VTHNINIKQEQDYVDCRGFFNWKFEVMKTYVENILIGITVNATKRKDKNNTIENICCNERNP